MQLNCQVLYIVIELLGTVYYIGTEVLYIVVCVCVCGGDYLLQVCLYVCTVFQLELDY